MGTRIAITGVSERDIDLLLLEEFQSSPDFQTWFVQQVVDIDSSLGQCVSAERSVIHATGESDLEVVFETPDGIRTHLMIENKVDAGLQPLQAQRYPERGNEYMARGRCHAFYTVLVAPAHYFGSSENTKGFGSRVTYEQILSWFQQADALGERRHYKAALLQSAIDKGILGYQPEEDAQTTDFWRSYWLLALQHAPELEMSEPIAKPSGAGFIYFRPLALPRGIDVVHKFHFGYVDLQWRGMGQRLNEIRAALGPSFEPDMTLEPAAKSAAIRIQVPKLNAAVDMAQQEQAAIIGIHTAKRFLSWFLTHGKKAFETINL